MKFIKVGPTSVHISFESNIRTQQVQFQDLIMLKCQYLILERFSSPNKLNQKFLGESGQ